MKAQKLSTLSSKGQTTIPQEVRNTLKLKSGDVISFEIKDDGTALLRKALVQQRDDEWLRSMELTLAPEWGTDDDDGL